MPDPLTRQRSPWVERELANFDGIDTKTFSRNVSDGTLWAFVAEEPQGWHLSISFRDRRGALSRYPSWDEITHARYQLMPSDIDVVMHLPRESEYIAVHPTTFHLHEHPERSDR